jgi:hypothetical protein
LSEREIVRLRLFNQGLTEVRSSRPEDVVSRFGAMQSQEHENAKWSVGKRLADTRQTKVDEALDDGRILRTHVLRPTWHYVARADYRWVLGLSGPRVHRQNGYSYRLHGIDAKLAARSRRVMVEALAGGGFLTRQELGARLEAKRITASGQRLAYIVMHAELDLVLTSGPQRGRKQTYALVDERAPATPGMDRDEALRELALRYFTSRGPATEKDFSWWSGLTLTDVRRGIAAAGDALEAAGVDGVTYTFAPAVRDVPETSAANLLVQAYDEYVIAYSESRRLVDLAGRLAQHRTRFYNPILIDGQAVGFWRYAPGSKSRRIEVELLRRPSRREREALDGTIDALSGFTGCDLSVS